MHPHFIRTTRFPRNSPAQIQIPGLRTSSATSPYFTLSTNHFLTSLRSFMKTIPMLASSSISAGCGVGIDANMRAIVRVTLSDSIRGSETVEKLLSSESFSSSCVFPSFIFRIIRLLFFDDMHISFVFALILSFSQLIRIWHCNYFSLVLMTSFGDRKIYISRNSKPFRLVLRSSSQMQR